MLMISIIASCKFIRYPICLFLPLTAALISGCGGGSGGLELAPVGGIVLYKGEAVEGAVVEFWREKSPTRSIGTANESGEFTMGSFTPNDGAPVGECQVTVTKQTMAVNPNSDSEEISDPPATKAGILEQVEKGPSAIRELYRKGFRPRNLLPAKYADPKTSGLTFEVKAGVKNQATFRLED